MKKNNWFLVGGIVAAVFLFLQFRSCGKSPVVTSGKVMVERIVKVEEEKPGDWQQTTFEDETGAGSPTAEQLQKERDHYFGRYQFYKQQAHELLKNIQERDGQIVAALGCDEAKQLQREQIEKMKLQLQRDSALIAELFKEFDNKGEKREYEGEVTGELFRTQWKATVFGVMPSDGLKLKTDVTQITTTIEKPFEVVRKNSIEAFAGLSLGPDSGYLLGVGYEHRVLKWAGIYGQAEIIPSKSSAVGKAGVRIHF